MASLHERFARLFRGLNRAHGIYELLKKQVADKKVVGKAHTVRAKVTEELYLRHLEGKQGLGIVPVDDEGVSYFGAIDIDKYDINIEDVEKKCFDFQLPLLPTRTKSGGVHLYLFCDGPVPSSLVKQRLEEWAIALGFGGSEIFPKQTKLVNVNDVGNWINLPYFSTFTHTTDRYGIFSGKPISFEDYVSRAERLRVTEQQLSDIVIKELDGFANGPPCLQSMSRVGFPQGMRNNSLFAIGVYLKKRYPDDWRNYLDPYNNEFLNPPLQSDEVQIVMKSLSRKDYNYKCNDNPCKLHCNRSVCRTKEFGIGKSDSEDWGIVIDSDVQKILTDPPHWIATVNGVRMALFSEDLLNQRQFLNLCMQKLSMMPPLLPGALWRGHVNALLASAIDIDAPEDAGIGGELEFYLTQFCTVFPRAETREEVLTGKPFFEDEIVYFRGLDFRRYLDQNHFNALPGSKLFAKLRMLGVRHAQLRCSGTNIRVWTKPLGDQEPVEVPTKRVAGEGM